MVGCFLYVASDESVPDILRRLQCAQSVFTSFVPFERHHLPQDFHALLKSLPLPDYPGSTSLIVLPLSTYRD